MLHQLKSSSLSHPFVKAMLIVVSLLIVTEVGLRFVGVQPGVHFHQRFGCYEFDPVMGWKTRPKTRYYRVSPEYAHFNYYGVDGLPRTESEWLLPLGNDPKIVLLGDSFVEAYYSEYESSFPHLIDKHFDKYQVMNLGVSGYSPSQYLLQARKYLPGHKLAHIVATFSPLNDLADLDREQIYGGYAKPVFGSDFRQPLNLPLSQKQSVQPKQPEDYSAILFSLQPLLYKAFNYVGKNFRARRDAPKTPYDATKMIRALSFLAQIKQEFAREASFQVVYVTTRLELRSSEIFGANTRNFQRTCEQLRLDCHVPAMYQRPLSEIFYEQDNHFSTAGSRLFADEIISLIEKRDQSSNRPAYIEQNLSSLR